MEVFGGFRGVFWRRTNDLYSAKMEMRVGIGKSIKILSHSFCTGVSTCGFADFLFPKCFKPEKTPVSGRKMAVSGRW
jgi:hypothetical protein